MSEYTTDQERFWAGKFGDEYVSRNRDAGLLAAKTAMFARILSKASGIKVVREFGANVGLNIVALKTILPAARFQAIEINVAAHRMLSEIPGIEAVCGSILDDTDLPPTDLSFTAGVLIHMDPGMLPVVYSKLYESSRRYIVIAEYYNPSPVEITYRGHTGKLFKRDFAGELMDMFPDLRLLDYGFIYHRDPVFPVDDLTWFLLEKQRAGS